MQYRNQHLTYCTNIHPGESWQEHFAELKKHFPEVKKGFSPDRATGIGLRLSNRASLDLADGKELDAFKNWLRETGAYVFTVNGFPYGAFHRRAVKANVHHPDWTTAERLGYTLRLFDILAELLPEGMDGGVSTSPLSYRHWFETEAEKKEAFTKATRNILRVAEKLAQLKVATGKTLHLDIEPEPDGLLQTGPEFIHWYENELISAGKPYFSDGAGLTAGEAETLLKEHVRLCYDVCHFAIGYENHAAVVDQLKKKGIKTGKIQVSAALRVPLPADAAQRKKTAQVLFSYNEAVYLHQVIARKKNGEPDRFRDLPDALPMLLDETAEEWRIHFHVPVFTHRLGAVQSTQPDICAVLDLQKSRPFTNHLEIETYTWEVLPTDLKLPVNQSICRELAWLLEYIRKEK